MGLSYDPAARKWNLSYEKTDYKTDYPTNFPTNLKTDYPEIDYYRVPVTKYRSVYKYRTVWETRTYTTYEYRTTYDSQGRSQMTAVPVTRTESVPIQQGYWEQESYTDYETRSRYNNTNIQLNEQNRNANKINAATNQSNSQLNATNTSTNQANAAKNSAYDTTVGTANNTQGGDYVNRRETIRNIQNIDSRLKKTLEDYYKSFYSTEKLQVWDASLGAKPPYGEFDPSYYKNQNPEVSQSWQAAVANDDIDITQRYGENGYYLQHYTNTGKAAGRRGNAAEITTAANKYIEETPTDADLQAARTLQLGIDTDTQTQRLLNIPEVAAEWEKAKRDDPYWDSLAKKNYLDVTKADDFAALFRLSDRPEDQQIRLNYNANAGYGITELEDAINEAVGEKAQVDVKKFGALAQNVLKDTISEMKKAKAREQELAIFQGFGGFSEIYDINKELSNSILGDSGVGGLLSFTSAGKAEESLLKQLQGISGVRNNVSYNWQQWFDNELKTKYDEAIELGLSDGEAQQQIKVEAEFAREFIDKYLIPRFDTSRSMDEFVEYLDIRQEEQNPFQTQDIMNAAKLVADIRSKQYIDQLKSTPGRYFDADFYFNPTGNKAREADYATQKSTVEADWEAAKNGDPYWAQQAYRFGIDVNDKDQFARVHFQVKGQGRGYDPADDILNASKVSDYIYSQILPALKEEALKQGSVFGQFLTPEEFADEMLRGLDPTDKNTWQEILERYGLSEFKGDIEELKQYVIETLRTGSAQQIREEIKYLNEKRQRPTQEVLGVTYIERPEDYKDEMAKPQTELYRVFQSSGYQGTEDEFYTNFFPDLDRGEQVLLTKSGRDTALKTSGLDLSDPFASLGTIESFFGEDKDTFDKEEKAGTVDNYFKLGLEDDDSDYKSKTGSQILGEFTSLFKGLNV